MAQKPQAGTKLTLSVSKNVKSAQQSFHAWHFLDKSENPKSEAVVSLRIMVTFVTWSSSRTSFYLRNCFITTFSMTSFLKGWESERKQSRRLPNTSTFEPNDRSQYFYCVLPIMPCAFANHLDIGLAERPTPRRLIGTVHIER